MKKYSSPMITIDGQLECRPAKLCELAMLYQVDPKTFRKWLKPFENKIGERVGHYYTTKQVKVILNELSLPEYYTIEHHD